MQTRSPKKNIFINISFIFNFWAAMLSKNESIHLIPGTIIIRKKQKNSLETQVVLLIFSSLTNYEISGVVRTKNTSKQQKMVAFARNCLVKRTLRLFQPISVVTTIVPTFLRQFRRLAQRKDPGVVRQLTKTGNFMATPM